MEPRQQQEDVDNIGRSKSIKRKWSEEKETLLSDSNKSKRISENNNSDDALLFDRLDEYLLMHVFLRVRASDLAALSRTCKRFHKVVSDDSSKEFRKLRAKMEWAETRVMPRRMRNEVVAGHSSSLNDSDFETLDIVVDKQLAGSIEYALVERSSELFERAPGDLQLLEKTIMLFFDDDGRCRIPSVKEFLNKKKKKPLLIIKKMLWNDEYRGVECSYVGAVALRSFLSRSELKNRWSICIYQLDYMTQCPQDDEKRVSRLDEIRRRKRELLTTSTRRKKIAKLQKKLDFLEIQDMRHFLRAGFRQVQETVIKQGSRHVFAVPSFLKNPILSKGEVEVIEIVKAPNTIEDAVGVNATFKNFVAWMCRSKSDALFTIKQNTGAVLLNELPRRVDSEIRNLREYYSRDELVEQVALSKTQLCEEARRMEAAVNLTGLSLSVYETALQEHGRELEMSRPILEAVILPKLEAEAAMKATEAETELAAMIPKFDEETARFVNEKGASIQEAFVIHVCAEYADVEFLDKVLSFVPEEEKRAAVNQLNDSGSTPLMVVAETRISDEKDRRMVERLIYYGASKDMVDPSGESALGKLRKGSQKFVDSLALMGFSGVRKETDSVAEAILMPSFGATTADDAYLSLSSDSEESDNEESDSDDSIM